MDIWFIINLITDNQHLINQGVIVPTNWVVVPKKKGENCKVKYMALDGQGEEDKVLIDSLAEKRIPAPQDWPLHLFRIVGKAHTWHEAQRTLIVVMGGEVNLDSNERIEYLLDTTGHSKFNFTDLV